MITSINDIEQTKSKIAALSEAILHKHPTLPSLLREIHSTVKQYPEQVTLLSEDEIKAIVNGLMVQTGVVFAAAATSGAKSGQKKKLKEDIATLGMDAF